MSMDPKFVRLNGTTDETIKTEVKINPLEKYPFKILNARVQNGDNIKIELTANGPKNNPPYILNIENMKREAGNYTDFIYLETDSQVKPEIKIRVYGTIVASEKQPPKS